MPRAADDRFLNGLRVLRRAPGLHFAVAEFGHRDRRLHGSVRQHGHVVIGLELSGGAGERAVEIAAIAHYLAGLVNAAEEFLLVRVGIETGVSGIEVPIDLQLLAALHGGTGGIRHHGDAAQLLEQVRLLERRKLHRLPHALHLAGLRSRRTS